jgi:hypothetical protein
MRLYRSLFGIVLLCGLVSPSAAGALAYGVNFNGELFRIDEDTPQPVGTSLGYLGIYGLNAMASDPSGRLFAIGPRAEGFDTAALYEIDPVAVSAQRLLEFHFASDSSGLSNANVAAMAFAPDGKLYFTNHIPALGGDTRPIISDLYVADLDSGDFERIGSTGFGQIQGLAFGPDSILYGFDEGTGHEPRNGVGVGLVAIDLETGAATDLDPLVDGFASQIQTIEFDALGNLYGARDVLYRLDPGSGAILSGQTIAQFADIRGMAFAVPEPSTLSLVCAGMLALRVRVARRRGALKAA